uniref:Sodium/hydrogen exchanger 8 n=2 Tax=Palpitomonas bilix TaxID=652834 RepID=A0A7S3DDV6_9EUKA|mmetsp:Transcript_33690/g.86371  ORF Transcript_33690/g.86371 Transcript_33690/m.86371 type:complete len:541 (+) Transcript_33690:297-1919(+)
MTSFMNAAPITVAVSFLHLLSPCVANKEELKEKSASWRNIMLLALLFICLILTYFIRVGQKNAGRNSCLGVLTFIPESIVSLGIGCLTGLALLLFDRPLLDLVAFDGSVFFVYLLPPIIFESGYSLKKKAFFRNFVSIIVFAVVGTVISTVIVAFFCYIAGLLFSPYVYPLPLLDSFIFGALISAVDPVATLAIFNSLPIDEDLYSLVFGESVLNDAVAVVLFRTLQSLRPVREETVNIVVGGNGSDVGTLEIEAQSSYHASESQSVGLAIANFFLISFGSIAIGCILALFSSLLLKMVKLKDHPSLELPVVLILSYFAYLIAEGLGLSGIMAILANGIITSHYTTAHLSRVGRLSIDNLTHSLAVASETTVFAILGVSLFSTAHHVEVGFLVVATASILAGRAANVFPLSYCLNSRRKKKITKPFRIMLWFSGLRGAIAFALAISDTGDEKALLVTTTFSIVIGSVIIFGGGTRPLVSYLNLSTASPGNDDFELEEQSAPGSFERFDEAFLAPIFGPESDVQPFEPLHEKASDADEEDL